MPKLTTSSQPAQPETDQGKPRAAAPRKGPRPCPRCFVQLVLERQYKSRGLSGAESVHEIYICPACDARYQHLPADGRWKELPEQS